MQGGAFEGVEFPYVALCPSTRKKAEFGSIKDVYDEIIRLYEEADTQGFNVGESIYIQSFYFADHALLVDQQMQNRIKEYQFCKQFNCPPYPSLKETPHILIEQFSSIEEEFNLCVKNKQEEKK